MPALSLLLVCDPGTRATAFRLALADADCEVLVPPARRHAGRGAAAPTRRGRPAGSRLADRRGAGLVPRLPRRPARRRALRPAASRGGARAGRGAGAGRQHRPGAAGGHRFSPGPAARAGPGLARTGRSSALRRHRGGSGGTARARQGHPVAFADAEFNLCLLLARHAGLVLTRDIISRELRDLPHDNRDRSIDLRVARIRRKLGDDAHAPRFIKSVRGEGYLFLPPTP